LVQRIKDSHVSIQQAEKQTIDFLQAYVNPSASPMCGNTICQDRRFLYNYMPKLEQFFHYRHIDVSTLKELAVRWKPEAKMIRKGEPAHLALLDWCDVQYSIHPCLLKSHHFGKWQGQGLLPKY
jgi:oligoribonuclease